MNKEYLKLKMPVGLLFNEQYWEQVLLLNAKEFKYLGIKIGFEHCYIYFKSHIELDFPIFEFNEIKEIQKYYETAQRILENHRSKNDWNRINKRRDIWT